MPFANSFLILLISAAMCVSSASWAAKPVFSLAEINRLEEAAQKQREAQARRKLDEAERRKTPLERDLENYASHKDLIRQWLEHAAEARRENLTWTQRILDFSELILQSGYPEQNSTPVLEALAVNLANAYRGKPAEGVGEMAAAGYRAQLAASPDALRELSEDTMVLTGLVGHFAPDSSKKNLNLERVFATKFAEHSEMALPHFQIAVGQLTVNAERFKNILDDEKRNVAREQAEKYRKEIETNAPANIRKWLDAAHGNSENRSKRALRIAALTKKIPDIFGEMEAEIWLSELATLASATNEPQVAESILLVAEAIALKTSFNESAALARGRRAALGAYFVTSLIWGYATYHYGTANSNVSIASAAAVFTTLLFTGLDSSKLGGWEVKAVLPFVERFATSRAEKANKAQAEKMLSYFHSKCEPLLEAQNNIRVAEQEGPRVAPAEVHDEEFQEEPEPLKRRSLR